MDTMFINQEGMLIAINQTVMFQSLVPINTKQHNKYYRAIDVILRKYNSAGFAIKRIHCDDEYQSMMDKVKDKLDVEMNYANALDHVPEAEQNNQTIKERVRAAYHCLPYKKLPRLMIRYLAMVQMNQLKRTMSPIQQMTIQPEQLTVSISDPATTFRVAMSLWTSTVAGYYTRRKNH